MLELLAFGTLLFWVAMFIIGVIITVLVENENGAWATVTAIGTMFLLDWAWKIPIVTFVFQHKLVALAWITGYFVVGGTWGIVKWGMVQHKAVRRYNDYKAEFLKENNAAKLTPALAAKLQDQIDRYSTGVQCKVPTARENKGRIIRWMTYWPFSIIGTFLNDVVRRAWHHVYLVLATTYDRIAVRMWRSVSVDMAMAKQFKDEQEKKAAEARAEALKESEGRRYR